MRSILLHASLLSLAIWPACVSDEGPDGLPGDRGRRCPPDICIDELVCSRQGICVQAGDDGARLDGVACFETDDCAPGLVCSSPPNQVCTPGHGKLLNQSCSSADPCRADFVCASDGVCKESGADGTLRAGAACEDDLDCGLDYACGLVGTCVLRDGPGPDEGCADADPACRSDLVCAGDGTCRVAGDEGTAILGVECESDEACLQELACGLVGQCVVRDGPGIGEECAEGVGEGGLPLLPCRRDLLCAGDGTCRAPGAPGTTPVGEPCATPEGCLAPFVCSVDGICAPAGVGAGDAEPCGLPPPAGPGFCEPSLACAGDMVCRAPGEPRTNGLGEPCEDISECRFGHICVYGTCFRPVPWRGADCDAEDPKEPPVAFFRVPRDGEPLPEFYRLPFPSDARLKEGGGIDMSGHAEPSAVLPDGSMRRYLEALEESDGFGLQPTIYLRLSSVADIDSFRGGEDDPARVILVNLDIEADNPFRRLPASWAYRSSRTKYICHNRIMLTPQPHMVLTPGQTYAALLANTVRPREEPAYERDADFKAMLLDDPPADPGLARAHAAHAPLRAWLDTDETYERDDILTAAVFTVGDPTVDPPRLYDAVQNLPTPAAPVWTLCAEGVASPCEDGLEGDDHVRGCVAANGSFHELHARISLPVFQAGTPPYLAPGEGGLDIRDDGTPAVKREEEVCAALTIPKGVTMPEQGWPTVLYFHGTNGSFRSFVKNGTAEALSLVEDELGEAARFAVLSIDAVQHGTRRSSDKSPEELFFNYVNPAAARGNVLQAAADVFSLTRVAAETSVTAGESPTGDPVQLDQGRIFFMGHSQGGITSSIALPYEARIRGSVLSGVGGGTKLSLLGKTDPFDIPRALQLLMGEAEVDRFHPMLNLVQWYMEPADPAVYARHFLRDLPEGRDPQHIFQVYGMEDTFSPPETQGYLARSIGLHQATPVLDDSHRLRQVTLPASENYRTDAGSVTAVMQQFQPGNYNGHFVAFRHENAKRRWRLFLATLSRDDVAQVVP